MPPMRVVDLDVEGGEAVVSERLRGLLAALDPRSVVRVRLGGLPSAAALPALRAAAIRAVAPPAMHVTVAWPRGEGGEARGLPTARAGGSG